MLAAGTLRVQCDLMKAPASPDRDSEGHVTDDSGWTVHAASQWVSLEQRGDDYRLQLRYSTATAALTTNDRLFLSDGRKLRVVHAYDPDNRRESIKVEAEAV